MNAPALPAPLLQPTDVSAFLGVPIGTLDQWRHRGTGPRYVRVGRHVRYRLEDVHAWVADQSRTSTTSPAA